MGDFEQAITGPCERCGEPSQLRTDPYDQDINNTTKLVYLCDADYERLCEEI